MARSSEKDQLKPPEEAKNVEWLIEIMKRSDSITTSSKPQIARVTARLLLHDMNKTCFVPLVVSLGPYHHGKEHLKPMEPFKEDAARWFINHSKPSNPDLNALDPDSQVKGIYNKFMTKVTTFTGNSTLKNCYAAHDKTIDKLNDEDLTMIMFLDGCFILHFIHLFINNTMDLYSNKTQLFQNISSILRDIFLLENQIPYAVLKSLMSLMPDPDGMKQEIKLSINEAFFLIDVPPNRSSSISDKEPLHLLDMLWTKLIGDYTTPTVTDLADFITSHSFCRPTMELKAAGIEIRQSHSSNLGEIKFNEGHLYGHAYLSLPQMAVNDFSTKSFLLNLAAYEICPAFPSDSPCVITSYICFLGTLIGNVDDVKELRSKGILVKAGCTDEEVVKIFNEATIDLVHNPFVLADIKSAVHKHCNSKSKVRFAELLHTYFSSPWTIFSLVVAFCFFILALLQTIFTIKQ